LLDDDCKVNLVPAAASTKVGLYDDSEVKINRDIPRKSATKKQSTLDGSQFIIRHDGKRHTFARWHLAEGMKRRRFISR
jgi:hypothetical protein